MQPERNSPAPYGYVCGRSEGGNVVLVPDPIQAAIVRRAFADRPRSRLGLVVVQLGPAVRQFIRWAVVKAGG